MRNFKEKRILITGGASGIGKIMGKLALERGAELVIWDINQISIDKTVNEFASLGKVSAYKIDLCDSE